jgi:hypothetical protein
MSTTLKIIYSVQGFLGTERDGQCYHSDGLNSLVSEAVEELRQFLVLFLIITHLFKGG